MPILKMSKTLRLMQNLNALRVANHTRLRAAAQVLELQARRVGAFRSGRTHVSLAQGLAHALACASRDWLCFRGDELCGAWVPRCRNRRSEPPRRGCRARRGSAG